MFYYWDGFEIDGSDTDFDLILPETQQRIDFVKCFLSMPVLQPWVCRYESGTYDLKETTIPEALKIVETGEEVTLFVNCGLLEQFPEEIQTKIYSFSATRKPLEKNYGKLDNPCMSPHLFQSIERGDMTLSLTVLPPGTKKNWYTNKEAQPHGYVRNPELLCSVDDLPCFTLNCGPGFYYEYAMYIMEYLQEHFPGMAITGGLDCAGGWTDGCTYAASIYSHECVRIPVKYSVKNTLKYLTQYDIIRSYNFSYKGGKMQYNLLNEFRLVNNLSQPYEDQVFMKFGEYADWVEKQIRDQKDKNSGILSTAIHILLPWKDIFRKNREALEKLTKALKDVQDPTNEWYFQGYFGFTSEGGETYGEFRVYPDMKPYLLTLLELAQNGEIEFMKEETYRRRHND